MYGKYQKNLSMGNNNNDKRKKQIAAVEEALSVISQFGNGLLDGCEATQKVGWSEFDVGDEVYFKTYNDIDDVVMVTKGTIVEVIRRDTKVENRPDSNITDCGWHTETSISYKVQWYGGKSTINARYVYGDKLYATLAAIAETVQSYFSV